MTMIRCNVSITRTRGYYVPMDAGNAFELHLIVTGMHMLPEFGSALLKSEQTLQRWNGCGWLDIFNNDADIVERFSSNRATTCCQYRWRLVQTRRSST